VTSAGLARALLQELHDLLIGATMPVKRRFAAMLVMVARSSTREPRWLAGIHDFCKCFTALDVMSESIENQSLAVTLGRVRHGCNFN